MKDGVKKAAGALLALLALAILWGCDKVREDKIKEDNDNKDDTDMTGKDNSTADSLSVKGRWGDTYGDTILEFDGDTMRVIWHEYKDEYKVKERQDGIYKVIENNGSNGTGFGVMSRLTINDDGTLTAYEEILDAEGHRYIFVPEEQLADAKAVKDFSEELPKVIESTDIKTFSLSMHYHNVEGLGSGHYSWTVEKQEDGTYTSEFDGSGDSYIIIQDKQTVDQDFIDGLVKLIQDEKLAEKNGMFYSTRKDDVYNSLYVTFASREKLYIRAGSEALDHWCVDTDKFFDYALSIVPEEYFNR